MPKVCDTLCWRCTRPGTGACSWDMSKGNVPVEGWKAERIYVGGIGLSYKVIECPLFSEHKGYDEQDRRARLYCDIADEEQEGKSGVRKENTERVYRLFREGLNNKDVAHRLGLAARTVRHYRWKWKKEREANENESED